MLMGSGDTFLAYHFLKILKVLRKYLDLNAKTNLYFVSVRLPKLIFYIFV